MDDFVPTIKPVGVSLNRSSTYSIPPSHVDEAVLHSYFLLWLLLELFNVGVLIHEVRIFDHLEVKFLIVKTKVNALVVLVVDSVLENEVDVDLDTSVKTQQ